MKHGRKVLILSTPLMLYGHSKIQNLDLDVLDSLRPLVSLPHQYFVQEKESHFVPTFSPGQPIESADAKLVNV